MAKLIALNKPFGVICQFSGDNNTLSNYVDIPNVYPAGRLDKDSEGLVILTDNGKLQNLISNPKYNKTKTKISFEIREVHNKKCGGDPETAPLIASVYVLNTAEVFVYNLLCNDYYRIEGYSWDMNCNG